MECNNNNYDWNLKKNNTEGDERKENLIFKNFGK